MWRTQTWAQMGDVPLHLLCDDIEGRQGLTAIHQDLVQVCVANKVTLVHNQHSHSRIEVTYRFACCECYCRQHHSMNTDQSGKHDR